MTSSRVAFDANVILELVLGRKNSGIVQKLIRNTAGELCISTLSVHLIVHFGSRYTSMTALRSLVSAFDICDLTAEDINWAFSNRHDEDFEDALQIAIAIRNGCNVFYTFDEQLVKAYRNLPTLSVRLIK